MIWYSEVICCKNQPDNINMSMNGMYYPPGGTDNIISIFLLISDLNCDDIRLSLFNDNPSYMTTPNDYIDPDDIKLRYFSKITKLRTKLSKMDIDQIIQKYRI